MPEWTPYRINIPRKIDPFGSVCRLETVRHVVHVPEARRILEDTRLRAGLVYDESRLNRSRTCVTWVSANTWGPGSIYGNVEFCFSWDHVIKGRHFYWVEAMTSYKPHAYRFLITDRDLSNSRYVTPYDPETNKGPLRLKDEVWYWNGSKTSEFMIDSDLKLKDCIAFDIISHHATKCRLYGASCPDAGTAHYSIGGRILAFILGNGIHCIDHVLKVPSGYKRRRLLGDAVDWGADGILRALGAKKDRFTGVIRAQDSRSTLMRGALALYGADQKRAARDLIALLKSQDIFEQALTEIINAHFQISDWTLPR
jgi:hypothetical protein